MSKPGELIYGADHGWFPQCLMGAFAAYAEDGHRGRCSASVWVTFFDNARPAYSGPHQPLLRPVARLVVAAETLVCAVAVVSGGRLVRFPLASSGNVDVSVGRAPELASTRLPPATP